MERRTAQMHDRGLRRVILVCTNDREEYACCADVDGAAVADAVRDWLQKRDRYWSDVAVAETSCLGMCSENGTAVVVQPDDQWFADVTVADVPKLLSETLATDDSGPTG